ncbi:hypothetical protein [Clostridium botulinum]|uniref:hypothetical protein n=1 Tax=Clostridium botulinum TaxID=1491 RepID=UPI0019673A97|nr:hypothetical protein [Clostridium botulinum]MBN1050305.1 hypothetical protein [Clostridium botulinum]
MKKKIIATLLTVILAISLVGCSNSKSTSANAQETVKKEETKSTNPLDNLKKSFADAGLNVGDNKELAFSMLGATNGYKFDINGTPIEIYYYDSKNLTKDQKKFYDQAKNGSVDMTGFNIPVKFKNNIMLARLDDHPNKDKILEVFNNFEY